MNKFPEPKVSGTLRVPGSGTRSVPDTFSEERP